MTLTRASQQTQHYPLLLIDDDRALATLIGDYCEEGGFAITSALSGEDGIRMARQQFFRIIILDIMLPGIDGFEVLKRLRLTLGTPILMLTTRGAGMDRVRGLDAGADDYLPKPFQPEELIARLKTILRRTAPKEVPATYRIGDLAVDEIARSVSRDETPLELTGAEFNLLKILLNQPGEQMSREELIPRIFGRDPGPFDRSIDSLITNLRRKLGVRPDGSERIKSIRNVGYSYVLSEKEKSPQ